MDYNKEIDSETKEQKRQNSYKLEDLNRTEKPFEFIKPEDLKDKKSVLKLAEYYRLLEDYDSPKKVSDVLTELEVSRDELKSYLLFLKQVGQNFEFSQNINSEEELLPPKEKAEIKDNRANF